jgi:hypothetical protein
VQNPRGKFVTEGYERLSKLVGTGNLKGSVEIDQLYAQDQHETFTYKHVHGGIPKYLSVPLSVRSSKYWEMLAKALLSDGQGAEKGMVRVVEDLSGQVRQLAPVEHGYLRNSAHPRVYDRGRVVYDRPARQRRLSEAEVDARVKATERRLRRKP